MYNQLHIFTEYSFLESGARIERVFKRAKEEGYQFLGITDHNVMMGFPVFNKYAKQYGIKPIFGMDFEVEGIKYSCIIKNEEGYQNLCILSTLLSNSLIDLKTLIKYKNGLFVILLSSSNIFEKVDSNLKDTIANISKNFDVDSFFLGLEFNDQKEEIHYKLIREFAEKYAYKTIAYPNVKYIEREEAITLDLLKAIREQSKLERDHEVFESNYHFRTVSEIKSIFTKEEIDSTEDIANKTDFDLIIQRGEMLHYCKQNESPDEVLIQKVQEGLKLKGINLDEHEEYRTRLNHEYKTIKDMGYCDYFLIVQDYVNFAKTHNIPVGPGRGSAAGSLIAYTLNITDVDPIKYDLLFERFLNKDRHSMPDIDIDFGDIKRDQIYDYLMTTYGSEKVAHIATIQKIGSKQAIKDIGRIFGVPINDTNLLTKLIVEKSGKTVTLQKAYEMFPNFKNEVDSDSTFKLVFENAQLIEGLGRQRGLHAAGVVLNNSSLLGKIPLLVDPVYGLVTQYEKDYLEDEGFLKMDILGIINLTTIERCLKLIKEKKNIDVDLKNINLDDPKIYNLISRNLTMGLFQIDTEAAQSAMKSFVPNDFLQLVAFISLDRPGPRDNLPAFSRRLKHLEKITYMDPSLEPALKETYGIMVYQEQIMKVSQFFAGFTAGEADLLRKACAKKKKDEMDKLKLKFIQGAIKKGHTQKSAENIFAEIEKFKDYGFPKAHSVSYTMITAMMGYLKAYYPVEFYAAILEAEYSKNDTKFTKFVNEIKKCGVTISLPDINKSTTIFDVDNDKLIMPLTSINGIYSQLVANIIDERKSHGDFKDFADFVVRMFHRPDSITDTQIAKLIDAGCFDKLCPNRQSLKQSTLSAIKFAKIVNYREGTLFNDFNATFTMAECEDNLEERLNNEFEALGVMLSDSPLNHIQEKTGGIEITNISDLNEGKQVNIAGNFVSCKKITTKNGKTMAFVLIRDNTGEIDCTMFSDEYEKFVDLINILRKKDIVLVSGKIQKNYKTNDSSFVISDFKHIG